MSRKVSELVVKLTDQVSGTARQVAQALKMAERQTKAIAAATRAGLGNKFTSDLQRMGASAHQVDRVSAAWSKYRREARLAADATKWTKSETAAVRQWERANIAALRNVNAAQKASARTSTQSPRVAAAGGSTALVAGAARYIGPVAAAYGLSAAVKKGAEDERAITRIGITADASKDALTDVGNTAYTIAQKVALPYQKVLSGLDVMVAQGRSLEDAMAFLPSVARSASATGAEVMDIAKTADAVSSNFKIAGKDMQGAFDVMAAGGKAGMFELPDMSRYLPSMAPAAAAAGFTGQKGLTELVSMLQVIRKGSGSSEEAASSMSNILQKMMSEETNKKFAKFGVDLEAGLNKGRKAGRNLVEVFEELTAEAIKGDLSKLPKLFSDMEFGRGMRALMSFRGEWQKLNGTISRTAAGAVDRDLERVTANTQAKLDRLANAFEKRMRQLGGLVADIAVPIDNKIEEITSGNNKTANAFNEQAQHSNADKIARQEAHTSNRGEYDPDTQRRVDARREYLERKAFDDRIAAYDAQIAEKQKRVDTLPKYPRLRAKPEAEIAGVRAQRDALANAQRAVDDTQVRIADNEGDRTRLRRTRQRGFGDYYGDKPQPIIATTGAKHSATFGLGPYGTSGLQPSVVPITPTMRTRDAKGRSVTVPQPLPPVRPDSLPKADPFLKSFDDIYAVPKVDTTSVDAAGAKAGEVKDKLSELNQTVTPTVNLASLQQLESAIDRILSKMQMVGASAGAAKSAVAGIGSAPAGRGRSDVATATANLSRSRQLNNTGREFTG